MLHGFLFQVRVCVRLQQPTKYRLQILQRCQVEAFLLISLMGNTALALVQHPRFFGRANSCWFFFCGRDTF